jgi:rhodanese-related sulfurtransferase
MTLKPLLSHYGNDRGKEKGMSSLTAAEMVAEARAQVENLSPTDVAAALDDKTLLLDIREPEERESQGVIPGAVLAPRGMLEFWADPASPSHREEFDPARRIVLYCASGGRSALAAATLRRMGYERVAHLDGGIKAWMQDGRTIDGQKV